MTFERVPKYVLSRYINLKVKKIAIKKKSKFICSFIIYNNSKTCKA